MQLWSILECSQERLDELCAVYFERGDVKNQKVTMKESQSLESDIQTAIKKAHEATKAQAQTSFTRGVGDCGDKRFSGRPNSHKSCFANNCCHFGSTTYLSLTFAGVKKEFKALKKLLGIRQEFFSQPL